ncbi:helix-turn-helix transcriptional regulator [Paenibacillus radicis (ex Gao et al. 2016)]|uniref:AraC family transcriptional regulator n=1 Tax=Paenibacillus radicis (ex Gao et al. 2016) TaxID=1737354 RepID=A0A917HCV9_9BACL|nr:AraC family transcriptional regulator [Paenibacillus radicis (ex Gao et al. 2016)]GGG75243.1 AraC family transcriptional regulator [Paenibacillus radicis (ex Gao et al. 2016)]
MGTVRELRNDSMIYHYSVDQRQTDEYALHCHPFYELFYFISGEVSYLIEGKRYVPTPHSLLLIPPNVFHGVKIESTVSYARYALHFVPDLLPIEVRTTLLSPFHSEGDSNDFYFPGAADSSMTSFFEQLMDCLEMDDDIRALSARIRLEALLTQLLFMSRSRKDGRTAELHSQSMTPVLAYLNEHLTTEITLDELSARFFISKHHLNKMFRKATGTTIGHYILHKRVVLASQLMQEGHPASLAAMNAGFQHYSSFYRAYKSIYGHSPTERSNQITLR